MFGLLAEFDNPEKLIQAALQTRKEGYHHVEAYTPFPVEGLYHALELPPSRLPFIVLIGGMAGCATGYLLQYYASALSYPLNIGGRPLHSWPAFIPVTFELTILFAAFFAVLGMFALNGLPQPYHPVFNVVKFELATRNRFFLSVSTKDRKFELNQTKSFLESLQAKMVYEIPD